MDDSCEKFYPEKSFGPYCQRTEGSEIVNVFFDRLENLFPACVSKMPARKVGVITFFVLVMVATHLIHKETRKPNLPPSATLAMLAGSVVVSAYAAQFVIDKVFFYSNFRTNWQHMNNVEWLSMYCRAAKGRW